MVKASWGGKSHRGEHATVVVEGNQYFPLDAVQKEFLKTEPAHDNLPLQGDRSLIYHVEWTA